jgi:hypothetical protein
MFNDIGAIAPRDAFDVFSGLCVPVSGLSSALACAEPVSIDALTKAAGYARHSYQLRDGTSYLASTGGRGICFYAFQVFVSSAEDGVMSFGNKQIKY